MNNSFIHRFIPNTAPGVREAMLAEIGLGDIENIYEEISENIRFKGELNIPKEPLSEFEVFRRIKKVLEKNRPTSELLSFVGAGCWPHYVPALCDEIISRSEFLTAYAGAEFTDHGRYQAVFEFQSMMAELLNMEVVGSAVYDGSTASGDALQMASRLTGRRQVLISKTISRDRMKVLKNYATPWLDLVEVDFHPETGLIDLDDLRKKIGPQTAAVFIENPGYLGFIEAQSFEIAEMTHRNGALLIANINPTSLGLIAAPGDYGADIVCGEAQPLGMHMTCGGACLGILAHPDEERFYKVMPSFLVSMTPTVKPGEYTYSWHTLYDRMVYVAREEARSFTGTSSWLWAISAAVYLSLMGPEGMKDLAKANMQKAYYAMESLSQIKGVKAPYFKSTHFNEFVINFDETGKSVKEINQALFERGIVGGKDLTKEFPQLGQSALYCATEIHSKEDIDHLAQTLEAIIH